MFSSWGIRKTTFYKKIEDVLDEDLQMLKDTGEIEGLQLE